MQTNYFNLDKSVNVTSESEAGNVYFLWANINRVEKSLCDLVGLTRGLNIKSCIEFLLKDPCVLSCTTSCGVTVYRGQVK